MQISQKNLSKIRAIRAAYIAKGVEGVEPAKAAEVVSAVLRAAVADAVGKVIKADAGFVNALIYGACVEVQPELVEEKGGAK